MVGSKTSQPVPRNIVKVQQTDEDDVISVNSAEIELMDLNVGKEKEQGFLVQTSSQPTSPGSFQEPIQYAPNIYVSRLSGPSPRSPTSGQPHTENASPPRISPTETSQPIREENLPRNVSFSATDHVVYIQTDTKSDKSDLEPESIPKQKSIPRWFYVVLDKETTLFALHLRSYAPRVLVTSTIIAPQTLFVFRSFAFAWCVMVLVFSFVTQPVYQIFSDIKYLSWFGLLFYFSMASTRSFLYLRRRSRERRLSRGEILNFGKNYVSSKKYSSHGLPYLGPRTPAGRLSHVFWYILSMSHFFFLFIMWVSIPRSLTLPEASRFGIWMAFNLYAMGALLLLFEFLVNRIPMFYSHWPWVLGVLVSHVIWIFVTHAAFSSLVPSGNYWSYSVFNPDVSSPSVVVGSFFGVLLLPLACFFFLCTVSKIRDRLMKHAIVREDEEE